MTANQIAYWNLQETKRANAANEAEMNRANMVREAETERSNRAKERETARTNRANEGIRREANTINSLHLSRMDSETQRHNLASEQQSVRSLELEQRRQDISTYGYQLQHESAMAQVGLGYSNLAESTRANLARENQLSINEIHAYELGTMQQESNARNAGANVTNAVTRAKEQEFGVTKWNDIGLAKEAAGYSLTVEQAKTEAAKRERMAHQNRTDAINAGANVLGATGRIISGIKLRGVK